MNSTREALEMIYGIFDTVYLIWLILLYSERISNFLQA